MSDLTTRADAGRLPFRGAEHSLPRSVGSRPLRGRVCSLDLATEDAIEGWQRSGTTAPSDAAEVVVRAILTTK